MVSGSESDLCHGVRNPRQTRPPEGSEKNNERSRRINERGKTEPEWGSNRISSETGKDVLPNSHFTGITWQDANAGSR